MKQADLTLRYDDNGDGFGFTDKLLLLLRASFLAAPASMHRGSKSVVSKDISDLRFWFCVKRVQ